MCESIHHCSVKQRRKGRVLQALAFREENYLLEGFLSKLQEGRPGASFMKDDVSSSKRRETRYHEKVPIGKFLCSFFDWKKGGTAKTNPFVLLTMNGFFYFV